MTAVSARVRGAVFGQGDGLDVYDCDGLVDSFAFGVPRDYLWPTWPATPWRHNLLRGALVPGTFCDSRIRLRSTEHRLQLNFNQTVEISVTYR